MPRCPVTRPVARVSRTRTARRGPAVRGLRPGIASAVVIRGSAVTGWLPCPTRSGTGGGRVGWSSWARSTRRRSSPRSCSAIAHLERRRRAPLTGCGPGPAGYGPPGPWRCRGWSRSPTRCSTRRSPRRARRREATARETIELALLAAIQHLAPLQRAVVILRDLPGWPAADSAEALGTSPASLNSALRRGRRVLGEQLPPRRSDRAGAGYRGAASAVATPGSAGPRKCGRGRTAASSTALPAATPSRSRP